MAYNEPVTTIQLKAITAAASFVVSTGHRILSIDVYNNTANAITGGLKFGTTVGGVDVYLALPVGANAITFMTDALLLKKTFSRTTDQTVFFDAVTLWNSANSE